ncbi:MAG: hypothetical protein K2K16_03900 [Ruminococcus sp.]|nr:hypothetical protein [Ruminococcus sp.]
MELHIEDKTHSVFCEDSYGRTWKYRIACDLAKEIRNFYSRSENISEDNKRNIRYINNGFFMISAYSSGTDEKSNKKNTDRLSEDVRSYGLGYIRIAGGYTVSDNEAEFTGELLFVPQPENISAEEFSGIASRISEKYNDGSVVASIPDYATGKEILSGNDSLIQYFSSLVGDVDMKTEWLAVRNPDSFTKAVLMSKNKENLLFRQ